MYEQNPEAQEIYMRYANKYHRHSYITKIQDDLDFITDVLVWILDLGYCMNFHTITLRKYCFNIAQMDDYQHGENPLLIERIDKVSVLLKKRYKNVRVWKINDEFEIGVEISL